MTAVSRIADRYMIRKACEIAYSDISNIRTASLNKSAQRVRREFSVELLEAFASPIMGRIAGLGIGIKDITKKVKDIWGAFKQAPKYWEEFKKMLGIKSTSLIGLVAELPKKVWNFFKQGGKSLISFGKGLAKQIGDFAKVFSAVSGQTALFNQVVEKGTSLATNSTVYQEKVKPLLDKAKAFAQKFMGKFGGNGNGKITEFFKNVIQTFLDGKLSNLVGTPLKAYVFFNIWINVTEISWDFTGIAKGMLGLISWRELFASLPESGVGLIISIFLGAAFPSITLFGPAAGSLLTKITGNWLMFIAPVFQIIILAKNKLIEFGKSAIKFFWDKMGVDNWKEQGLPEVIPLKG